MDLVLVGQRTSIKLLIFHLKRGERANEFIQALKKIWIDDVVEFKGKYYNIPASKVYPKPIQKPHIPVYLGGFSPNTFSRIVKYDINGWLGVVGGPLEYLKYYQGYKRTGKSSK